MKLISWNVNGIRSVLGKGLLQFWAAENPDVLCLQETKAQPEQVPSSTWPSDFAAYWNSAEKRGYSGVVTFAKNKEGEATLGIDSGKTTTRGALLPWSTTIFF